MNEENEFRMTIVRHLKGIIKALCRYWNLKE